MSPTVATWINVAISVLGFLAGGATLLTPVFGQSVTAEIVGASGLALGVVGAINIGLHGTSAPQAGPMLKYITKTGV